MFKHTYYIYKTVLIQHLLEGHPTMQEDQSQLLPLAYLMLQQKILKRFKYNSKYTTMKQFRSCYSFYNRRSKNVINTISTQIANSSNPNKL